MVANGCNVLGLFTFNPDNRVLCEETWMVLNFRGELIPATTGVAIRAIAKSIVNRMIAFFFIRMMYSSH